MAFRANSGVVVQYPERDAELGKRLGMALRQPGMRLGSVDDRRAANAAKTAAVAWRRLVIGYQLLALKPLEVGAADARPAAECGPLLLPAERAMTIQRTHQR